MLALLRLLLAIATFDPSPVSLPRARVRMGASVRTGIDRPEQDEGPARLVEVAAFTLDRTEVTRGAYTACVLAGACVRRQVMWTDLLSRLPMTDVRWSEAAAYCRAVGGRLPTELEWERAARGTGSQTYPWGDAPDCARANWGNYEGEGRCPDNPGRPVAVASYPPSSDGLYDLAGNVWEWTADYYGRSHTAPTPRGAEELGRAPRRSVRGGACCSILAAPRTANRVGWPEDYRDTDLGFRCAR
ncbi:MAG: SUMF1/EgtB/PvdO family nonheme iron enzyme [Polyangia bacterium]